MSKPKMSKHTKTLSKRKGRDYMPRIAARPRRSEESFYPVRQNVVFRNGGGRVESVSHHNRPAFLVVNTKGEKIDTVLGIREARSLIGG